VLSAQRRMVIMDELQQSGLVLVGDLAERLGVSEMTIRRDLELLERTSDIVRVHGGAMRSRGGTAFEPSWNAKVALRNEAKARIGKAAAARVSPGDTILIDSGTTALWVARSLRAPCAVVVVDVKIAVELAGRPTSDGVQVLLVGGAVRSGYFSTTGQFALEMLEQLHVDRAFLGADAIDFDAGVTNATVEEAAIKKQIIAAANEVVLVADATKLGKVALAKVAPLADFSLWITDADGDAERLQQIRAAGLPIEVV
jgi:DeoR/GlpR family transcriptional regulator of sugar metabolism